MNMTGYSTLDGVDKRKDARTNNSRLLQGSLFHGFAPEAQREAAAERAAAPSAQWESFEVSIERGERLQHVCIELEYSGGYTRRMEFTTLSRRLSVIYGEAMEHVSRNCSSVML